MAAKTSTIHESISALRNAPGYHREDTAYLEWGDESFDDYQCHMIADEWVLNGGTPERFLACDDLIARLIKDGFEEDDDDEPKEYAFARQWREAGGSAEDFRRLVGVIEGKVFNAMPWSYRKPFVCLK